MANKKQTINNCECPCCNPVEEDTTTNVTVETKEYTNWEGLVLYTKEFKEWILKLFRKAHARMGHIEEDLAKTRKELKVDYQLEKQEDGDNLAYTLIEKNTGTEHGSIVINAEGIILPTWNLDGDLNPNA